MSIYNYTTGEYLRKATEEETRRYLAMLEKLPESQREVGAVRGEDFGFPDLTIYMD